MWLYVSGKDEKTDKQILCKKYNVEYELGNGKINTFSSTLVNIDDKYYWFLDDYGLNIIKKDRVITMVSQPNSYITVGELIERVKKESNKQNNITESSFSMNKSINQDMIIFKLQGYPPNDENFIFEDGEVLSNSKFVALLKLNELGYKVIQMEIDKSSGGEWWLIEKLY